MAYFRCGSGGGTPKTTRYVNTIGSGTQSGYNANTQPYNYSASPQHGGIIVGTYINCNGTTVEAGGSATNCGQTSCSITCSTRYGLVISWTAYAIEIVVEK